MLPRVKRAMMAEIASPSDAAAGSMWSTLRAGLSLNGTWPRVGSHGAYRAPAMITTVPMKKAGAEMNSSEKTRVEASRALPARVAATTPRGMPTASAMAIAMRASCSVTG